MNCDGRSIRGVCERGVERWVKGERGSEGDGKEKKNGG